MMNHAPCRILLVALALLIALSSAAASDWPTWRGPDCNGISPEVGWRTDWTANSPPVLWQAKIASSLPKNLAGGYDFRQTSVCSVANGRLYVYSDEMRADTKTVRDFVLICLDALTGKELWRHAVPTSCTSIRLFIQAPTVDGDTVFMYSPEGMLEKLNATSGAVIWSNDLRTTAVRASPVWKKDGIRSSPLIINGLLMVPVACRPNGKDADVIAVRVTDGSLVWSSSQPTARIAHGSSNWQTLTYATINGLAQVVYLAGTKVVGLNIKDGATVWEFEIPKEDLLVDEAKGTIDVAVAASPVVDGNAITFSYNRGHSPGKTFCIDIDAKNSPHLRWKNDDLNPWKHSFISYQGYLYGCTQTLLLEAEGTTICLDPKTGKIVWEGGTGGEMILADGKLIVWDGSQLHLIKAAPGAYQELAVTKPMPATGKVSQKWAASYTPILSNGLIYCRNELGDLFCVDVRGSGAAGKKP